MRSKSADGLVFGGQGQRFGEVTIQLLKNVLGNGLPEVPVLGTLFHRFKQVVNALSFHVVDDILCSQVLRPISSLFLDSFGVI